MTEQTIQKLNITINIDNLTIGDLEVIDRVQRKEAPVKDMLDLLDKVVVGGARHLPLSAMQAIMDRVQSEIDGTTNPPTGSTLSQQLSLPNSG